MATGGRAAAELVYRDASLYCGNGWHCRALSEGTGTYLEDVVDVLRNSTNGAATAKLRCHIIYWHGYSPGKADGILRRLRDGLTLEDEDVPAEPGASSYYDHIESRFQRLVETEKGRANSRRHGRLKADFKYWFAVRNLRGPSPNGKGLGLTQACEELLGNTPAGRHALARAKKQTAELGDRTGWDVGKMLDYMTQRYERPQLVPIKHTQTISLDAFMEQYEAWDGALDPKLKDRRLELREETALARAMHKEERERKKRENVARQTAKHTAAILARERRKSDAFRPNLLNVAVQPFLTGDMPISDLHEGHLNGHYELPRDRAKNGQLHTLRCAVSFRHATERFLQIEGYCPEEAEVLMDDLLSLHSSLLREYRFRKLTGVERLVAYKPRRAVVDERTEVLREIAWSQLGFFRKHDLTPILTAEETEAVLGGRHASVHTGSDRSA
jgi:hypothetical protein